MNSVADMAAPATKKSVLSSASVVPLIATDASANPASRLWNRLSPLDRKLVIVGASSLGVGLLVGGSCAYLYRRWTVSVQREQVEVLSRSLSDVYAELRSLQQGMVQVQDSLTALNKEDEGKRRRPRKLQFYDSDSDEGLVYLSADEGKYEKGSKSLRSILKKPLQNGYNNLDGPLHSPKENGDALAHALTNGYGLMPPSPLLTPSDDDDYFEDALQDPTTDALLFEKEFQRGDLPLPGDSPEPTTPFDAMDMVLDASVTDDQVEQALDLIKSKQSLFPDNADYLWRLAKATFIYGNQCLKHDTTARVNKMKEAKEYADAAKKLNPTHPDVLKWCALTTGGLARYAETTQKINYGLATRELLQQALDLRPNDASLHHILGRWNYEITQLGWIERTAVRTLFGKYAQVTLEDAKKCFLEAERIKPKMFKSNMYFIAKCFAQQGQKEEARKWLEEALQVQRLCVEDEQCDNDIEELKAQL